jgi:hypothetical protein
VQYFGRSNPNYSYHLAGSSLVAEDYVKDLGVIVSRDLSYHKHIDSIISASVKSTILLNLVSAPKAYVCLSLFYRHISFLRLNMDRLFGIPIHAMK